MKIAFAAAVALSLCAGLAQAQEQKMKIDTPHIVVSGAATHSARPDVATLTLGVDIEAATATEASARNAEQTRKLIETLKALGVEAKDIRTEALSLAPIIFDEQNPKTGEVKRSFKGYRASNMLRVRLTPVERAGAIVAKVVESGANAWRGLDFSVSDATAKIDELRGKAVADARRRATLYAAGAGAKLGRLLLIEADPDGGVTPAAMRYGKAMAEAAPIPLEPGVEELSANVRATWELVE